MKTLFVFSGIFFLIAVVSGIRLSKMERPLNSLLFTVHKLSAIAMAVVLVFAGIKIHQGTAMTGGTLLALFATGGFIILEFASGAILSFDKYVNKFLQFSHRIFPVLIVILGGYSFVYH